MYKNLTKKLIICFAVMSFFSGTRVFADEVECEGSYGYWQECEIKNKVFRIEKEVKMKGESDDEYRSKVTDVDEDEKVVFLI